MGSFAVGAGSEAHEPESQPKNERRLACRRRGDDVRQAAACDGAGEVLLSYEEGRYLYLDEVGVRVAKQVGCTEPLGQRIFDVAPGLRHTTFGRYLEDALQHRKPYACIERMEHVFPGTRLSAVITPKAEGVHVRFRHVGIPQPDPSSIAS